MVLTLSAYGERTYKDPSKRSQVKTPIVYGEQEGAGYNSRSVDETV